MKRREAGMTKVDIIVLVVLIVVGVPVLWVLFFQPEPAPKRSVCLNNVRQIGLAMLQYAEEYDGKFPPGVNPQDPNEPAQHRFAYLMSLGYINSAKVFICLSHKPKDRMNPAGLVGKDGKTGAGSIEATEASVANNLLQDEMCSYGVDPKVSHKDEGTRAVLGDRPDPRYWGTGVNSPASGPGSNSDNHHGDGQNVFYNDGHVVWRSTVADDVGVDPNIYATNPEVNAKDDANIDFGMGRKMK